MLRRIRFPASLFVTTRGCFRKNILPVAISNFYRSFSTSAEDLFAELENNNNNEKISLQKHENSPNKIFSKSRFLQDIERHIDFTPSQNEKISLFTSQLLANKIELLSSVSADRRERGLVDTELEKKYGPGSSRDWILANKEIQTQNKSSDEIVVSSSGSNHSDSVVDLLSTPRSFSDSLITLQKTLDEVKKSRSSSPDDSSPLLEPAELDLLFSCAMQSTLAFSRSPTEARQVLDMVKLFSMEMNEIISSNDNNNNHNNDKTEKSSSSPLVWMAAVEAGALSLATPEFFTRLLDEALNQIDKAFFSSSTSFDGRVSFILPLISTFYTSALSWAASQYDVETSLKVWSHFLATQTKLQNSGFAQDESILQNAALVIRSTNDMVASNSYSVSSSGESAAAPDSMNTFSNTSALRSSSSIGASASKFDGGVRNSMYKFLMTKRQKNTNNNAGEENGVMNLTAMMKLTWQKFEAILSCFDNETQVKLMKMRMISSSWPETEKGNAQNDSGRNQHQLLFELLKRLVASADVSGAEDVAQVLLTSEEKSSVEIKNETILLMLRLYCDILSPTDFDSALSLFTKYCREGETEHHHDNNFENSGEKKFSFSCPPTSEHYSVLLRGVDSADDAASLFLDACSAGVVLDASSYRFLFQRESNITLERLRQQLPEASAEALARLDGSGVVPPLPLEADAHALRLNELESTTNDEEGKIFKRIPLS